MNKQNLQRLRDFASLDWYDEVVKFVFTFVTKTSELLLAAGIVVSTANFLTDGDVMRGIKPYPMPGLGRKLSPSTPV